MLQFLMNLDREILLWIQAALRHDILTPLFIGLTRLGDLGVVCPKIRSACNGFGIFDRAYVLETGRITLAGKDLADDNVRKAYLGA